MDYIEFKLWKLFSLCVLAFLYGIWQAQVAQLIKDMDMLTENVQAMRDLMEQSRVR